ncbi:MAG: 30S ribosomal protein S16 [Chlamydiales bacterium]|nr:30S ribosomal protein S16 [Chlamydiales bacterium]MCH9634838.1 30S ribosomal protein S16 [Chlamydiales bacterium]MCH9703667.1 30S ribosomal protein S16 [Chlamydiota bacterium]
MALKIRLRSQGRRNHVVYRLVLTEATAPRDGKYIELLGTYDPHVKEKDVAVNAERTLYWLRQGAELTQKAEALVKRTAPDVLTELNAERSKVRLKRTAKKREARKKRETAAV